MCACEKCDYNTPCGMDVVPTGFAKDPFFESEGGWYFLDETGADQYGPYNSKIDAAIALGGYTEKYLTNPHASVTETGKEVLRQSLFTIAKDAISQNHEHHKMYGDGDVDCGYDQSELFHVNTNALALLEAALK